MSEAARTLPVVLMDRSLVARLSCSAAQELDKRLTPLTYLFNNQLTIADVATYAVLHPVFVSTESTRVKVTMSSS